MYPRLSPSNAVGREWPSLEAPRVNENEVRAQLKDLMIAELNLSGKKPADIDDAAPLFGAGLGLDSLDALQLAMIVEEKFGVKVPEGEGARAIFASVNALVAHIVAQLPQAEAAAKGA
jgi:acyl carrier protein